MGKRGKQLLALVVVVLVISGGALTASGNSQQSSSDERPPLGPVFISPEMGSWDDFQRPIFRASGFDLAKVHLPPGFDTDPFHVEDLIEDGATTIMLKTEDCSSNAETTSRHLVDRGFIDLVEQYPDIEFVVQVGNEPEHCPISMSTYVDGLFEVITEVKPVVDQPNLRWIAGMPMSAPTTRQLLSDGWVQELYDGVGTNMLAHFSLTDETHNWHQIVDYVLENTEAEIWLTEIGINHPPMNRATKAERMLEYVDTLPVDRIGGVAIFTMGRGTDWPQYELTESMVPVFAGQTDDNCRFFAATEEFLCDPFRIFWERHGGLPIFGYPITPVQTHDEAESVQFLERARFEWHPGVWPEENDVLLGHLGREMVRGRKDETVFESTRSSEPHGDECRYFAPTGQHLCDEFLTYWNEFGGLPVFGYPISQEFIEGGFRVQYFERARFEHQPGVWAERHDVLQGLLGVQAVQGTLTDGLEPD